MSEVACLEIVLGTEQFDLVVRLLLAHCLVLGTAG